MESAVEVVGTVSAITLQVFFISVINLKQLYWLLIPFSSLLNTSIDFHVFHVVCTQYASIFLSTPLCAITACYISLLARTASLTLLHAISAC